MRKTFYISLLFLTSLTLSCLKVGSGTGGVGLSEINLEMALPNGRWEGTGQVSTSNNPDSPSDMTLTIDNNEITEDFFTNGMSSLAVHKLKYTSTGHARWLDGQDRDLGECQCYAKSCHCFADDGHGKVYQMSLSFTEHELSLEQSGEVNLVKFHNIYKLRIK